MASHESPLYIALKNQRGIEITPGHILNHHLYGSGTKVENIAPITKSVNNSMAAGIERTLQTMVLSNNEAVHYIVTVDWPGSPNGRGGPDSLPEDKQLPVRVLATLQKYTFDAQRFSDKSPAELADAMGKWENWKLGGHVEGSPAPYRLVVPTTAVGLSRLDQLKAKRQGEDKALSWPDFYRKHSLHRLTDAQRDELKKV